MRQLLYQKGIFNAHSAAFFINFVFDVYVNRLKKMDTKVTITDELRVKELLKERGMMMKDFAEQIGISRETLTRALQGNPQYSTLKTIADGLGLSVRDLFKPQQEQLLQGVITYNGEAYVIRNREDFDALVDIIHHGEWISK